MHYIKGDVYPFFAEKRRKEYELKKYIWTGVYHPWGMA